MVLPNGIGAPYAEMDLNGVDIQRRAVLRSCVGEASLPPSGPCRGWGIKTTHPGPSCAVVAVIVAAGVLDEGRVTQVTHVTFTATFC